MRITLPYYERSEEELLLPFQQSDSAVSESGLRLVSISVEANDCSLYEEWLEDKRKGSICYHRPIYDVYVLILILTM